MVRSPEYWSTIIKNARPVAESASFYVEVGKTLVARINATDDFDTVEQLLFTVSQIPRYGTVQLNGPEFTYTSIPNDALPWQDIFSIKVRSSLNPCPCHSQAERKVNFLEYASLLFVLVRELGLTRRDRCKTECSKRPRQLSR